MSTKAPKKSKTGKDSKPAKISENKRQLLQMILGDDTDGMEKSELNSSWVEDLKKVVEFTNNIQMCREIAGMAPMSRAAQWPTIGMLQKLKDFKTELGDMWDEGQQFGLGVSIFRAWDAEEYRKLVNEAVKEFKTKFIRGIDRTPEGRFMVTDQEIWNLIYECYMINKDLTEFPPESMGSASKMGQTVKHD